MSCSGIGGGKLKARQCPSNGDVHDAPSATWPHTLGMLDATKSGLNISFKAHSALE